MDKKTRLEKNLRQKKSHFNRLKIFIKKIHGLTHSDRLEYIKKISKIEINFINEIVCNFLKKKIKIKQKHFKLYTRLKRLRSDLWKLADKNNSISLKKKILSSIRGLAILNFLLPIVKEAFDL